MRQGTQSDCNYGENVISGGFGESVCQLVSDLQLPVRVLNISLLMITLNTAA